MNKGKRVVIDIALGLMLVFEMFYALTGNFYHEIVGVLFFVTLIVHTILSRTWIKGIAKKATSGRRLAVKQGVKMGIMTAVFVSFVVLFVSSLLISNVLESLIGNVFNADYGVWTFIHTVSAYALCGFTILHVGLHWTGLFQGLKIPYNPSRRSAINAGVMSVAALGAAALSVAAAKSIGEAAMATAAVQGTQGNAESSNASGGEDAANLRPDRESTKPDRSAPREMDARESDSGGGTADGDRSTAPNPNTRESGSPSNSSPSSPSNPSGSSSSTTGYCTLCSKHCPLSSPRCNKPYAAGLI